MSKLFITDSLGNLKIDPEFLAIPELQTVWEADKSKDKLSAMKDMKYIHFVGYPLSPYRKRHRLQDLEVVVKRDAIQDPNYKPSKAVIAARKVYEDLMYDKTLRMLEAAEEYVEALTTAFRAVPKSDLADIKKGVEVLNNLGDVLTAVLNSKDKYTTALSGGLFTRKKNINKRELPPNQR
jgi:hypothetical protein